MEVTNLWPPLAERELSPQVGDDTTERIFLLEAQRQQALDDDGGGAQPVGHPFHRIVVSEINFPIQAPEARFGYLQSYRMQGLGVAAQGLGSRAQARGAARRAAGGGGGRARRPRAARTASSGSDPPTRGAALP